jgi:hypothetical protein
VQGQVTRRSAFRQLRCKTRNVSQVLRERLPATPEVMLPQPRWIRMRPKHIVSAPCPVSLSLNRTEMLKIIFLTSNRNYLGLYLYLQQPKY